MTLTPWTWTLLILPVVWLTGCRRGELAELAARAKAEGKTQVSTSWLICEDGSGGGLDDVLKGRSVFVVEPVRSPAGQSVTRDFIYTWHVVRVLEVMSLASAATVDSCLKPPPDLAVAPDELGIPALHGTAVIDGISVTMHSNRSITLDPGQHYLVIARRCGANAATLPHGPLNIFAIDDQGSLLPLPDRYPAPFRKEMIALGTVDELATRLRRAQARELRNTPSTFQLIGGHAGTLR